MNDFNEHSQTNESEGQKPVGFCQNCGKSLNATTVRVVGPAVYCEPCLAARLAGTPVTDPFAPFAPGVPGAGTGYTPADAEMPPGWVAPPIASGTPNPGLAALLGFIPGVGAMYNEQYAKGIVHLIVFTVLVSLTNATDIFIIFVFGWEAYMAIEAHHTAKARRDGLPLPNPFGLNDIGERMGFGKAWPASPGVGSVVQDAANAARGFGGSAPVPPPPGAGTPWGAPLDFNQNYASSSGSQSQPGSTGTGYGQNYPPYGAANVHGWQGTYASPPYASAPYDAAQVPPIVPVYVPPANRFPAGAVWLIGLGAFFLVATTGTFAIVPARAFVGIGLVGLGIWTFIRRMSESGAGLANDGSALYPLRVFRALRLAIWLALAGVWFLLDAFHIVRFHKSWPLFVILAGVMTLMERLAYNSAAAVPFSPAPVSGAEDSYPVSATTTEIVPASHVSSTDLKNGGN